ncbi:hypothetical protein RFI_18374, partial [Reticulomyxa filosa]
HNDSQYDNRNNMLWNNSFNVNNATGIPTGVRLDNVSKAPSQIPMRNNRLAFVGAPLSTTMSVNTRIPNTSAGMKGTYSQEANTNTNSSNLNGSSSNNTNNMLFQSMNTNVLPNHVFNYSSHNNHNNGSNRVYANDSSNVMNGQSLNGDVLGLSGHNPLLHMPLSMLRDFGSNGRLTAGVNVSNVAGGTYIDVARDTSNSAMTDEQIQESCSSSGSGGDASPTKKHGNGGSTIQTSVVMINNLNEEEINCDRLFALCEAFGDVRRVKISYNRRDTAFVQMQNHRQASTVMHCLDGVQLFGKMVHVSLSRMARVKLPKDSPTSNTMFPDAKLLTKDYTNIKMHRHAVAKNGNVATNKTLCNFGTTAIDTEFMDMRPMTAMSNGSISTKHSSSSIAKPSHMLLVSNLPEHCTQEDLFKYFGGDYHLHVKAIPNPPSQAFLLCSSVDVACQLLMLFHGSQFRGRDLHIAFARNAFVSSEIVQPNTSHGVCTNVLCVRYCFICKQIYINRLNLQKCYTKKLCCEDYGKSNCWTKHWQFDSTSKYCLIQNIAI